MIDWKNEQKEFHKEFGTLDSWAGWKKRAELAEQESDALQAEITELRQKLARYDNPDYVLVTRMPTKEMRQALESGFEFDHSESNYDAACGYEAMIEAVEKDDAKPTN